MSDAKKSDDQTREKALETGEWLESIEEVMDRSGPARVRELLQELSLFADREGVSAPFTANTAYLNTIPTDEQPSYPGDLEAEERLTSFIRWNAMAMVVRANRAETGIGGHISTYASVATIFEVAFNHFLRGRTDNHPGDMLYLQGHASPGVYARAFLEGRLPAEQLDNFRHELHETPGLSSYPHPWLMPGFWQFPTVSMGLGPICSIYHARFIKYLEDRGLKEPSDQRVWAFLGDGEMDEPESLGAINLASREHLDNLIFVVNCNLQRLDGPVRGNGKIVQELEAAFRGAGWNVIKVLWGSEWEELLDKDTDGVLAKHLLETVDGQFQKYAAEDGAFIRKDFFGKDPALMKMVENWTDEQIKGLSRGGHDPVKVYAAYDAAVKHTGSPTVILCQTVKGYGLGEFGEALNITHNQKKLNDEALLKFRTRFDIPLSDDEVKKLPFYMPPEDSAELQYLKEHRETLGGFVPERSAAANESLKLPPQEVLKEFLEGTGEREVSTTMAYVRILATLLRDESIGPRIVPLVPDEARTLGMESLFRKIGIYSHPGQLYEPVDKANLLYYKEASNGQILEEGITESGCLSSFIAAGTSYSNHGITMIPFFSYYSMFGLQRAGDLIWAAADSRARGFLIGATSGRTTLAGEGLQHQDGNSHLLAMTIPNLMAYDPAFAYELAIIIHEGLRRMVEENEDIFYYITVMNENYAQPEMPKDVAAGVLKGLYRIAGDGSGAARLLGSGAILREALMARKLLAEEFDVDVDVWSATSYKELHRDAASTARWNMLHPGEKAKRSHLEKCMNGFAGPVIAASDYVKAVPGSIGRWMGDSYTVLGTDGFGRSDGREALRDFFEVDAAHIAFATLAALKQDSIDLGSAAEKLGINCQTADPETR
ncbi:MAG: pyruvate dehydrogenase (acetyl-transferring), homodimeric type [Lentisphaeria bacterium]